MSYESSPAYLVPDRPLVGGQDRVKPRYAFLDALRGALALLIVSEHIRWLTGTTNWVDRSQLVVNCFFLLAGFSFGLSRPRSYGEYLFAKLMRLYPIYWIALGFAFLLGSDHNWATLLVDLTGLQGLIPHLWWAHEDKVLPIAWFVSCLLQIFLIAPFFGRLKTWALTIVFVVSLLVLIHPFNWRLYVLWNPYGGFFAQKLYLFLGGLLLYRFWPSFGNWTLPIVLRPLIWVGAISYPLFLIHFPVLRSIWDAFPDPGALFFTGLPVSFLFAILVHKITE